MIRNQSLRYHTVPTSLCLKKAMGRFSELIRKSAAQCSFKQKSLPQDNFKSQDCASPAPCGTVFFGIELNRRAKIFTKNFFSATTGEGTDATSLRWESLPRFSGTTKNDMRMVWMTRKRADSFQDIFHYMQWCHSLASFCIVHFRNPLGCRVCGGGSRPYYPGIKTALNIWKTAVKIIKNVLFTFSLFYEKNTNFHLQWYNPGIKANFTFLAQCGILISESKLLWKWWTCIRLRYLLYRTVPWKRHINTVSSVRYRYIFYHQGQIPYRYVKLLVISFARKWGVRDSVLRIRDVYPRIPDPTFFHPG